MKLNPHAARSLGRMVWLEDKTVDLLIRIADKVLRLNHNHRIRILPQPSPYAILDNRTGKRFFIKAASAHCAKMEFDRSQVLYETGIRTGLFRAPRPVALLEKENIIVWEHLEGMVGFREYLVRHKRSHPEGAKFRFRLARRLGEVLAAIHDGLHALGPAAELQPIAEFRGPSSELSKYASNCIQRSRLRPPHGDFACSNLFVAESADGDVSFVVVDAVPNQYLFPAITQEFVCSIYVDCAQWLYTLRCHRATFSLLKGEMDEYVEEFVKGYETAAHTHLDVSALLACAAEVSRRFQAFRDAYIKDTRAPFSFGEWGDRRFRLECVQRLSEAAAACMRRDGTTDSA